MTFSIRTVAERTGLSPHTIRAWERRYGALSPGRTGTNRRVYDNADVERLKLLKQAIERGHSIGLVAGSPTEELLTLTEPATQKGRLTDAGDLLDCCLEAVRDLDADGLDAELKRATVILGVDQALSQVMLPILEYVGKSWQSSDLGISREHMATAAIRARLDELRRSFSPSRRAPKLLVTTPAGQTHELGALTAAVLAARDGWNVAYLGPNLPFQEIANALSRTEASALALSLVFPEGDPATESDLDSLRHRVGTEFPIIVGGRAVASYAAVLERIGAIRCERFEDMQDALLTLQRQLRR